MRRPSVFVAILGAVYAAIRDYCVSLITAVRYDLCGAAGRPASKTTPEFMVRCERAHPRKNKVSRRGPKAARTKTRPSRRWCDRYSSTPVIHVLVVTPRWRIKGVDFGTRGNAGAPSSDPRLIAPGP